MTKTLLATLLITVAIGPAGAAEPRQPTARWVVNYDDAQCVATRNYGTEDKPLHLALKPSPTGKVMRVLLVRPGVAPEAEQHPASIRFDDQDPIAVNALAYGDRAAKRVLAAINLPMERFAAHRQAGSVEIKAGSFDERLAVPGLGTVMAAFDDCLASLRDSWNVGEPHRSRLSRAARPKRELSDLFRSTKYPAQAMRQGESGRVGIAMLVDETGKVADCMVEETSGYATLDSMSCYVIATEARFEPAAGVDGKPVRSAYFQRINWRIRT